MEEEKEMNHREKELQICPELATLLKIPEERCLFEDSDSLDTALTEFIVEALVKYGKDREQILRVSQISGVIAREMGFNETDTWMFEQAALIYDIGNLEIDPAIYKKGNRLSFEEFEIIKEHTLIGYALLQAQKSPLCKMAASLSVEHHEWFDGSGYPYGLVGSEISMFAKIVAVADTVSALFVPRYGRQAIDFEEIVTHLKKRKGTHFDPLVIDQFVTHREEIGEILEYGFIGKAV